MDEEGFKREIISWFDCAGKRFSKEIIRLLLDQERRHGMRHRTKFYRHPKRRARAKS